MDIIVTLMFMLCHLLHVTPEFFIKTDTNPTYLEAQYRSLADEIFPKTISVNVSLTHFGGTLIYSIDANRNQLLVRMLKNGEMFLDLEFRGKPLKILLSEICGCKSCLYVPLAISVTISSDLQLQCNGYQPARMSFDQTKLLDYDYPTMNLEKTNGQNSAILWLINTPRYENLYPNPEQMQGCIFNVDVNGSPIYTRAVGDIGSICKMSFKDDVFHGGGCCEAYPDEPVCDCCKAFGNGLHCKDESKTINEKDIVVNSCISQLKVSWKGVTNSIFVLKNKVMKLQLTEKNNTLYLFWFNGQSNPLEMLNLPSYDKTMKYVLLMTFRKTVTIHMPNIIDKTVNISEDLCEIHFETLDLISGNGVIDLVYKTESSGAWKRFPLRKDNVTGNHSDENNIVLLSTVTAAIATPSLTFQGSHESVFCRSADYFNFVIVHASVFYFVAVLHTVLLIILIVNLRRVIRYLKHMRKNFLLESQEHS